MLRSGAERGVRSQRGVGVAVRLGSREKNSQHRPPRRGAAVFAVLRMTRTVRLCSPWNLFNVREHPCPLRERLDGMSDTGGLIPGNTSPWKQRSLFLLLPVTLMDSSSWAAAERGSYSDCSWRSHTPCFWFDLLQCRCFVSCSGLWGGGAGPCLEDFHSGGLRAEACGVKI